MKLSTPLFGAAYYDEYLPVDRIDQDMEMLRRAGMNVIRIAESTWSTWEPQDNVFDFTHLHRMLACSKKHGIQVIVGTPTYAVPAWLVRKYPDILAKTHQGQERYGRRQNMDITHPMFLKHAERIIRRLMEEVAPYDHVIGFQLDNETKAYDTCSAYAQEKFVAYLQTLFHDDLSLLNQAWGLNYWSNRIDAWEDFPDVRGTINGSLGAEYQKFQRMLVSAYLAWQSGIVREYARPEQFITQNFDFDWRGHSFGMQPDVDHWEAAASLTVAGCDIYHPSAQDLTGKEIAFGGAIARSLKKDNYLVLETQAQGLHGWLPYPGQLTLLAMSHLANGANAVMYWHWHSIHNACESYWKGVLSHNLRENATYREAARIGAALAEHGAHLVNLKKRCPAAILLDNESLTALQWFPTGGLGMPGGGLGGGSLAYNDIFRWIWDALYELNVECDVLSVDDTDLFGQYNLLITPALYSVSDALLQALKSYVSAGGVLLSTFRTAVADRMLKIHHDDLPHGLTEVFGMTYDQFTDAIGVELQPLVEKLTDSVNFVSASDTDFRAQRWMELLIPQGAETLARYSHPHWGSYAALTGNTYGTGYAAYLGCHTDTAFLKGLLRFLCQKAGIDLQELTYPVIVKKGKNDLNREVTYYFNYSEKTQTILHLRSEARLLLQNSALTQQGAAGTPENDMNNAPGSENALPHAPHIIRNGDALTLSCWDFVILESVG